MQHMQVTAAAAAEGGFALRALDGDQIAHHHPVRRAFLQALGDGRDMVRPALRAQQIEALFKGRISPPEILQQIDAGED